MSEEKSQTTTDFGMSFAPKYLGVKIVKARPMTQRDYATLRGYEQSGDQNPPADGYMVQYEDGYISWCPAEQFAKANRPVNGLNFGHAIEAAKKGLKIARSGWNGKGMFVFLRKGRTITGVDPASPMGGDFESRPHLCMKDAQGMCVVGWLASQTDILSDDWMIVE